MTSSIWAKRSSASPRARFWIRHSVLSAAFYGSVVAGMWAAQDIFIYPGAFLSPPEGYDFIPYEGVLQGRALSGPQGEFFALHAAPAGDNPVVIAFHGNGTYPEDFLPIIEVLLRDGYGVIAPAYPGYPRSPGHPSEAGVHAVAKAAYEWSKANHRRSQVVVLGHSLGTGPAVKLASEQDVSGLLLLAPFLSLTSVAEGRLPFLPVDSLIASPFRSDLYMSDVKAPILAFHGRPDRVVPFRSGEALLRLAASPAEFIPLDNVGHVDILFDAHVIRRVRDFMAALNADLEE